MLLERKGIKIFVYREAIDPGQWFFYYRAAGTTSLLDSTDSSLFAVGIK